MFGSRKRKKRAAEEIRKTTESLLKSGQQLSEENIQALMLAADGKVSARDKKILKQSKRQTERTNRTISRQDGKTSRTAERANARKTAYENGIDPRGWIADTAGEVAKGVIGVASASALGKLGQVALKSSSAQTSATVEDYSTRFADMEARIAAMGGGSNIMLPPGEGGDIGYNPNESTGKDKNSMFIVGGVILVAALLLLGNKKGK